MHLPTNRDYIIQAMDEIEYLRDLLSSACSSVKKALKIMDKDLYDYDEIKSQYEKIYMAHCAVDELATYLL